MGLGTIGGMRLRSLVPCAFASIASIALLSVGARSAQAADSTISFKLWNVVFELPASPRAPAPGEPAPWSADFSTGDFSQWSWSGRGDDRWGHIDVVDPAAVGIPPLADGFRRVGRMTVTADDAANGRYHAKLYESFSTPTPGGADTVPADVSGSYTAWYYIPSSYRLERDAWTNLFQFKLQHADGQSDPLWWIQLGSGAWARSYAGAKRWIGSEDVRPGQPVAFVNRWDNDWDRRVVFTPIPLDRWFRVRADLRQDQQIDFYIDGWLFDTARAAEYPVSPFGSGSEAWIFGVGNYSTAPDTTLYVGSASYQPR